MKDYGFIKAYNIGQGNTDKYIYSSKYIDSDNVEIQNKTFDKTIDIQNYPDVKYSSFRDWMPSKDNRTFLYVSPVEIDGRKLVHRGKIDKHKFNRSDGYHLADIFPSSMNLFSNYMIYHILKMNKNIDVQKVIAWQVLISYLYNIYGNTMHKSSYNESIGKKFSILENNN